MCNFSSRPEIYLEFINFIGEGQRPIFDREDIVVNQEEPCSVPDRGGIAVNQAEHLPASNRNQEKQHAIVEPSETLSINCQSTQRRRSYR